MRLRIGIGSRLPRRFGYFLHLGLSVQHQLSYLLSYSVKIIDLFHGKTIKVEVEAEVITCHRIRFTRTHTPPTLLPVGHISGYIMRENTTGDADTLARLS